MSDVRGDQGSEVRYKAGDVCRMADVQPYVLRYWESEFSVLAPERGAPGPRLYTSRDVRIIERIKKLLYDEGYTIAGAKKRLEGELKGDAPAPAAAAAVPVPAPEPEPARPPVRPAAEVSSLELAPRPDGIEDVAIGPEQAPEPKRRRTRTIVPAPAESAGPALFDVERPAAVEPQPKEPPRLELVPAPKPQPAAPDARIPMAIAELREILALLSSD